MPHSLGTPPMEPCPEQQTDGKKSPSTSKRDRRLDQAQVTFLPGISQMVGCSWVRGVGWNDFLASGSWFKRIRVDLTAVPGLFSMDLVGCRPVLMLRLALLVVQEDTSPVAINPFLGSGSLLVHPDAALANLRRSIARRMSRNNSRGTATSAI